MSKKISLLILLLLFLLCLSVHVSAYETIPYDCDHYIDIQQYKEDYVTRICTNEDFYTTLVRIDNHEYFNV